MGGGALFSELFGRETAGLEPPESFPLACAFFQGAADPFAGFMPGNTETGFEDAFAASDLKDAALGVGFGTATGVEEAAAAALGGAGGLLPTGGGGGGAGFGGTSSR